MRISSLAVCKGGGVEMTEANIINHLIYTINSPQLQEKSRFGYLKLIASIVCKKKAGSMNPTLLLT